MGRASTWPPRGARRAPPTDTSLTSARPSGASGTSSRQHRPSVNGGYGTTANSCTPPPSVRARSPWCRRGAISLPVVTRTLDGMLAGAIVDDADGGFFRYASGRDWTRPRTEKVLEDQGAMALLLAEAAVVSIAPTTARVRSTRSVRAADARRSPHAAGSSPASAPTRTTWGSGVECADARAPVVDRTLFTDAQCTGRGRLAAVGAAPGRAELGRFALLRSSASSVASYSRARVSPTGPSPARSGLLADRVPPQWALLHLHEATAHETYPMLAPRNCCGPHAHGMGRGRRRVPGPCRRRPDDVGLWRIP